MRSNWNGRTVLGLVLLGLGAGAAVGSCGSDKNGNAGNSGGTGGVGGTAATGGTTATTGGSVAGGSNTGGSDGDALPPSDAAVCNIPCLLNLSRDCLTRGSCQADLIGVTGTICYQNGINVDTGIVRSNPVTTRITYKKVDGSICFSIDTTGNLETREAMLTYLDAAGAVVATAVYDAAMKRFNLTCEGAEHVLRGSSGCPTPLVGLAGVSTDNSPASCPPGDCP